MYTLDGLGKMAVVFVILFFVIIVGGILLKR
jgi:hypothetical protein